MVTVRRPMVLRITAVNHAEMRKSASPLSHLAAPCLLRRHERRLRGYHQVSLTLTLCAGFCFSPFLADLFEPALWVAVTAAFVMENQSASAVTTCLLRLIGTVLVSPSRPHFGDTVALSFSSWSRTRVFMVERVLFQANCHK